MRGIVFDEGGLSVADDLTVRDLRPDEVRVDLQAAGVCHSDVSVVDGTIPFPTPGRARPRGHRHRRRGRARTVTGLAVGDHVVISTLSNCGACDACDSGRPTHCRESIGKMSAPFRQGDRKVLQFANIGAFSEQTVVKARQAVSINKDVPFEVASLLGCGVITGVGAVFNRAKVTHGQSVLVVGVGGIGLNVIQGAAPGRRAAHHRGGHQPPEGGAGPPVRGHPLHQRGRGRHGRGGQGDLPQRRGRVLRVRRAIRR